VVCGSSLAQRIIMGYHKVTLLYFRRYSGRRRGRSLRGLYAGSDWQGRCRREKVADIYEREHFNFVGCGAKMSSMDRSGETEAAHHGGNPSPQQ